MWRCLAAKVDGLKGLARENSSGATKPPIRPGISRWRVYLILNNDREIVAPRAVRPA